MTLIQLASLGAGVAQNSGGATAPFKPGTIYLHDTATPVTLYTDETGGTILSSDGTFTTDSLGHVPGWATLGLYVDITIPPVTAIACFIGGPAGAVGSPGVGANWRGVYAGGTTYALGDGVTGSNGHNYISLSAGNVGHDPTTDGGVHWSDLLPSSVVAVSSGTPTSGQVAQFTGVGNAVIPASAGAGGLAPSPSSLLGKSRTPMGTAFSANAVGSQILSNALYNAFLGYCQCPNGDRIIVYRQGTTHVSADGVTMLMRCLSGNDPSVAGNWSAPAQIFAAPGGFNDLRDCALAVLANGTICLSVFATTESAGTASSVFVATSSNNGTTWGALTSLPSPFSDGHAACSGPVLQVPGTNTLIQPVYSQTTTQGTATVVSTNLGTTWSVGYTIYGSPSGTATGECWLYAPQSGLIVALIRDPNNKVGWRSQSADGGNTWSTPAQFSLSLNGRPAGLITPDGDLFINTRSSSPNYGVVMVGDPLGLAWSPQQFMCGTDWYYGQSAFTGSAGQDNALETVYAYSPSTTHAELYFVRWSKLNAPEVPPTDVTNLVLGSGAAAAFATNNNTNNVVLGAAAHALSTTLSKSVVIGQGANPTTQTVTQDVVIGQGAQGGSSLCTVIGYIASPGLTGSGNTVMGAQAASAMTSGTNNTAIGFAAVAGTTTSNNTALGKSAAAGTTGGNNTAVGASAGNITSGANNTNVGFNARSTGTLSNTTTLGGGTTAGAAGVVAIGVDSAGTGASSSTANVIALGTANHQVQVSNNATGAGSAALGANCPAVTATAPYSWLKMMSSDGSTVYVPAWK